MENEKDKIKQRFNEIGAIITGSHFVYTPKEVPPGSGIWKWFHGPDYVAKEVALEDPLITEEAAKFLAEQFRGQKIDLVIGPELGAIILAHEVAFQLTKIQPRELIPVEWGCVRNLYAEKKDREQKGTLMVIRRGFDKRIPGRNVLVTEDVLTSGGSARRTVEAVQALGGKVVGLAVLCNRGNVQPEAVGNVPITAIFEVQMPMYPVEEGSLCAAGVQVRTDFGKGADFLKRKGKN